MVIGLLPEVMAADLVAVGKLQPINLTGQFPQVGIFAVYPEKAFQLRRIGLFSDLSSKAGISGYHLIENAIAPVS
ncbi:hypothetical protein [Aliiroseovarius crassostreae]|uniref:hypothetical protein n=1 Tax=Aliiroseovarius crassostreae TaxID=154981 RepID=UPI00223C42F1|nr:hypothetical protein [Aliiroseovarius crassostreae]